MTLEPAVQTKYVQGRKVFYVDIGDMSMEVANDYLNKVFLEEGLLNQRRMNA